MPKVNITSEPVPEEAGKHTPVMAHYRRVN